MTTITIPKEMIKEKELIVIPRREYEQLLKQQKVVPVIKLTPSEKRALEKSRGEMARGEFITLKELEHELGITHRKKR
ncbi:hypothetical protein A2W60_02795 [Candidatus Azambacteria bacterium RIFCSPHIGHO2_02_46_12]|uniref:Uncharacterized protein n=1 Tax=Candidatus Azambacteria bacterium RIFCSPHIGHO2_02_46_12 TaxID=1797295 RepID=A0A1F5BJ33_9BACT|nr:MAG: hypothetical protein A2W60_02795 [Candidatus Azambacteria bacterium RIFCSPHIGHO2_02_46_12]